MKGFRLSWHQWDFSSTRAVNVVGSVHEFVMMGFAHLFGRYKDGQFLYPTRLFGEFFPQVGGFPDPRITHDTYPLVLSGENDLLPCYYYVRGAVVKVAQAFWSDPSCTMHQIDIQLELGEATDIKFPVLLSNHVVGKDTLPKVGEVVHAVVRMQARIWLANQQVLQGMKDSHSMHQ
jgi:hypothetical protein